MMQWFHKHIAGETTSTICHEITLLFVMQIIQRIIKRDIWCTSLKAMLHLYTCTMCIMPIVAVSQKLWW